MLVEFPKTGFHLKGDFCSNLAHHTRNVPVFSDNPSRHIVDHFTTLLDSALAGNNSSIGGWFEATVLDALLVYRSPTGASIDVSRIMTQVDIQPPLHAEVDILVKPSRITGFAYFLYLKTSFRERWKQVDRDSIIASFVRRTPIAGTENYVTVALFFREHRGDSLEVVRKQAAQVLNKSRSIQEILSVSDVDAMKNLFCKIAEQ